MLKDDTGEEDDVDSVDDTAVVNRGGRVAGGELVGAGVEAVIIGVGEVMVGVGEVRLGPSVLGRSRMSLTEKLLVLGILMDNNLGQKETF
jgi:hypothetical protein